MNTNTNITLSDREMAIIQKHRDEEKARDEQAERARQKKIEKRTAQIVRDAANCYDPMKKIAAELIGLSSNYEYHDLKTTVKVFDDTTVQVAVNYVTYHGRTDIFSTPPKIMVTRHDIYRGRSYFCPSDTKYQAVINFDSKDVGYELSRSMESRRYFSAKSIHKRLEEIIRGIDDKRALAAKANDEAANRAAVDKLVADDLKQRFPHATIMYIPPEPYYVRDFHGKATEKKKPHFFKVAVGEKVASIYYSYSKDDAAGWKYSRVSMHYIGNLSDKPAVEQFIEHALS